ncbi:MAG: PaaI family thioesterase [Christensenellales bacterium]|jgi:acyl-coenzyme A thioesterase PaaI-like protein
MKHKVLKRQYNSEMCFVCGTKNCASLHARFYVMEGGECAALFTPPAQHQGYPDRVHGGIAAAVLDETIGRSAQIARGTSSIVTVQLDTTFKKPVPIGMQLRAVGRVDSWEGRVFHGSGEILLPDGEVAVCSKAVFVEVPPEDVLPRGGREQPEHEYLELPLGEGDPEYIEY